MSDIIERNVEEHKWPDIRVGSVLRQLDIISITDQLDTIDDKLPIIEIGMINNGYITNLLRNTYPKRKIIGVNSWNEQAIITDTKNKDMADYATIDDLIKEYPNNKLENNCVLLLNDMVDWRDYVVHRNNYEIVTKIKPKHVILTKAKDIVYASDQDINLIKENGMFEVGYSLRSGTCTYVHNATREEEEKTYSLVHLSTDKDHKGIKTNISPRFRQLVFGPRVSLGSD